MECEPEELQFLGMVGIYREAASILRAHRPLFARIAAAFVLPLSLLFLLHIAISHALFSHIDSDDSALDSAAPGTPAQRRLLHRLADDWLALLLFKAAYLLALLLFSLLSTAAAVFSVASVYSAKHDALSCPRVLSVVPRVWRRLAATFLAAFLLLFAYHLLFVAVFVALLVAADSGSGLAALLAFLLALAYIRGPRLTQRPRRSYRASSGPPPPSSSSSTSSSSSSRSPSGAWVVRGATHGLGAGSRLLLGLAMLAALCAVVMLALVVQTVVYLVCKSYHHESIDKSNLSDHLEVYLGEYVPLKASDVQMEQFNL
ncbi:hypothetical protein OsJ_25760 [Oryza sativa Japonica Group]|uniref:Uncharacterized protein n=1 Tax=Oryza sativa subsp. japonica TaxID=39947 RepID=B9FYP3_ORYSJ|nr:hypothetical protein OsJ_25760 [Oryza sativa Japonica Group]